MVWLLADKQHVEVADHRSILLFSSIRSTKCQAVFVGLPILNEMWPFCGAMSRRSSGAMSLELAKKKDELYPSLVEGEKVFTIGSPLNQQKIVTSGIASKIEKAE